MNKVVLFALVVFILLVAGVWFVAIRERTGEVVGTPTPTEQSQQVRPTDEEAELTAFGFVQDFIASAPPDVDSMALSRAYDTLSLRARQHVSKDAISKDLAGFVGVQDVPDQGASVEDLQVSGDTAQLIVGLNFSGGRVLRAITMVIENGEWKVDSVEALDQYPPE